MLKIYGKFIGLLCLLLMTAFVHIETDRNQAEGNCRKELNINNLTNLTIGPGSYGKLRFMQGYRSNSTYRSTMIDFSSYSDCEKVTEWINQVVGFFPNQEPNKFDNKTIEQVSFNLYSDKYFEPIWGKSWESAKHDKELYKKISDCKDFLNVGKKKDLINLWKNTPNELGQKVKELNDTRSTFQKLRYELYSAEPVLSQDVLDLVNDISSLNNINLLPPDIRTLKFLMSKYKRVHENAQRNHDRLDFVDNVISKSSIDSYQKLLDIAELDKQAKHRDINADVSESTIKRNKEKINNKINQIFTEAIAIERHKLDSLVQSGATKAILDSYFHNFKNRFNVADKVSVVKEFELDILFTIYPSLDDIWSDYKIDEYLVRRYEKGYLSRMQEDLSNLDKLEYCISEGGKWLSPRAAIKKCQVIIHNGSQVKGIFDKINNLDELFSLYSKYFGGTDNGYRYASTGSYSYGKFRELVDYCLTKNESIIIQGLNSSKNLKDVSRFYRMTDRINPNSNIGVAFNNAVFKAEIINYDEVVKYYSEEKQRMMNAHRNKHEFVSTHDWFNEINKIKDFDEFEALNVARWIFNGEFEKAREHRSAAVSVLIEYIVTKSKWCGSRYDKKFTFSWNETKTKSGQAILFGNYFYTSRDYLVETTYDIYVEKYFEMLYEGYIVGHGMLDWYCGKKPVPSLRRKLNEWDCESKSTSQFTANLKKFFTHNGKPIQGDRYVDDKPIISTYKEFPQENRSEFFKCFEDQEVPFNVSKKTFHKCK